MSSVSHKESSSAVPGNAGSYLPEADHEFKAILGYVKTLSKSVGGLGSWSSG